MSPISRLAAAAAFLLIFSGAAGAEDKPNPCKTDLEKFCKDIKPGEGRIIACLKKHDAELSAECKAGAPKARPEAGKEGSANERPCEAELKKFCGGVKPGEGRMGDCVKEHEKDLSETCRADLARRKGAMTKKDPCFTDIEKFCKDVKPGEGRIIACLKTHNSELSETCKARQTEAGGQRGERREPRPPSGPQKN